MCRIKLKSDRIAKRTSSEPITLRAGELVVEIDPLHGASINSFFTNIDKRKVELFRTLGKSNRTGILPLNASCFSMIPYAGRLKDGRFSAGGKVISFPTHMFAEQNTSHGDGWMRRWEISKCSSETLALVLSMTPSSPLKYRSTQEFMLAPKGLHIRITIWNDEEEEIPFGCGLHPYFPRRQLATISANLPSLWKFDDALLPVALCENSQIHELMRGKAIRDLPTQSEFWDWDGHARITWEDSPLGVQIRSRPRLKGAVLWGPRSEEFFCFEPISHSTNAFNFSRQDAERYGVKYLEPNDSWEQNFYFDVICPEPQCLMI